MKGVAPLDVNSMPDETAAATTPATPAATPACVLEDELATELINPPFAPAGLDIDVTPVEAEFAAPWAL